MKSQNVLTDIHVQGCSMRPAGDNPLFLKYSWFENSNYLLDSNAVLRECKNLAYLQLHIPEYVVQSYGEMAK